MNKYAIIPSWTTKQVTVAGSNVNTSVTFTKDVSQKTYYLKSNGDSRYGLFINNTRYLADLTYEIKLTDKIEMERPEVPSTRWYVNNQFIGTGSSISFIPENYLYSVDGNKCEFIIRFE